MWLESKLTYNLIRDDPQQSAIPWRVDVRAIVDEEHYVAGQPDSFIVGRLLADEIRRYEAEDWGTDPEEIADADSTGLLAAYCALLDEDGEIDLEQYDSIGDSIVYLYRFVLHEDFASWRMAVLDGFCRLFSSDGLVLAQHHTTWFSMAEFRTLGFKTLPGATYRANDIGRPDVPVEFLVRSNAQHADFNIENYPEECPPAHAGHEQWLEKNGKWDGLL
jgi:hypothetical protein